MLSGVDTCRWLSRIAGAAFARRRLPVAHMCWSEMLFGSVPPLLVIRVRRSPHQDGDDREERKESRRITLMTYRIAGSMHPLKPLGEFFASGAILEFLPIAPIHVGATLSAITTRAFDPVSSPNYGC